uniref:hypothetical protein n=1 Tax=Okeania sp. SIO2F4 TaxID=2607790 RepID=UPI00343E2E49
MAKNAEDRYQNAWGLKHDLEKCREQLNATWGAKAKTNQLEEKYPQLLTLIFQSEKCDSHPSHTKIQTSCRGQVTTTASDLDLASVIKASQAISEEIELEVLLCKMTRIVAENAGANKCVLIFSRGDKLVESYV